MYYGKANIYAKDAQYDKTSYKLLKWIPYTQTRGTAPNFGGGNLSPQMGGALYPLIDIFIFQKMVIKWVLDHILGVKFVIKLALDHMLGAKFVIMSVWSYIEGQNSDYSMLDDILGVKLAPFLCGGGASISKTPWGIRSSILC